MGHHTGVYSCEQRVLRDFLTRQLLPLPGAADVVSVPESLLGKSALREIIELRWFT